VYVIVDGNDADEPKGKTPMANGSNLHKARKAKNDEFVLIEGEDHYFINRSGVVVNSYTGKTIKGILLKTGYVKVALSYGKQKLVHRLVAKAFIPNEKCLKFVNHIDENPQNNHVDNLEWVTHKENIRHSCQGSKSYLFKPMEYYETNPSTKSDFKRICTRHGWEFDKFEAIDSGLKRYSNRKFFYIYKK
jgi:hypothetical protein